MKPKEQKEKIIDEIVKIIQKFQYNNELSEIYKREILDQDKIYDWQSIYIREYLNTLFMTINTFLLLLLVIANYTNLFLNIKNKRKWLIYMSWQILMGP